MKRTNRHGLQFQLLLVLKLFVACVIGASCLVYYRGWVEGFMKEEYFEPPKSLQATITAITMHQPIQKLYQEIPSADRSLLFDYWMATEPIHPELPRQLLELDSELFIQRAERTLICGSSEQRSKVLDFFRRGAHQDASPVLRKAAAWAERRKMNELANEINSLLVEQDKGEREDG